MKQLKGVTAGAVLLSCAAGLVTSSAIADIAPGTVLSAANIDELKGQQFDGHLLGDLLAESQEMMIRQHGWTMELQPTKSMGVETRAADVTDKFTGQASLNSDLLLENYTSGIPFPNIDESDPQSGYKLAYNILRYGWVADTLDLDPMYFLVIDGKKGLQREMGWRYKRFLTNGRLSEPYSDGGDITKYESLINLYPQDSRGLGILTVNYSDGRLADTYAYIKSIRRVRRLSSGAWADPVSATDFLTDETFGINLEPTWYKNWKIVGSRWIMAVAHGQIRGLDLSKSDPAERFPDMRLDEAPYWNFNEVWEPREVWMLEATPPESHLNSKRLLHVDKDVNAPMMSWIESFDRKGELWRVSALAYNDQDIRLDSGQSGVGISIVGVYDVQRLHATVLYRSEDGWKYNPPDAQKADFTPESLPRSLR